MELFIPGRPDPVLVEKAHLETIRRLSALHPLQQEEDALHEKVAELFGFLLKHGYKSIKPEDAEIETINYLLECLMYYTTQERWMEGGCDGCENETENGCPCNLENPIHQTFLLHVLQEKIPELPPIVAEEDDDFI